MDINGAKALKKRLAQSGTGQASPAVAADVHEDAPPVYHWLGVSQPVPKAAVADAGDEPATPRASLFRRLGLSFR